ncbi:hypothetical protein SLA2020_345500 [Shorea laevis]
MHSISVSSELTTTGSFCKPSFSLHRFSFPFLRYPFSNIPNGSPATAIHAQKRDPRSQPVLKPSIVEDVSMGDEEDDEEGHLLFDDSKDGILLITLLPHFHESDVNPTYAAERRQITKKK